MQWPDKCPAWWPETYPEKVSLKVHCHKAFSRNGERATCDRSSSGETRRPTGQTIRLPPWQSDSCQECPGPPLSGPNAAREDCSTWVREISCLSRIRHDPHQTCLTKFPPLPESTGHAEHLWLFLPGFAGKFFVEYFATGHQVDLCCR